MAFELTLEDARLVVSPVGAGLESWSIGGRELFADGDFHGKVLAPRPGRLRDGRHHFDGAEHQTPLTEPERHNALHGLTTERRWREALTSGDKGDGLEPVPSSQAAAVNGGPSRRRRRSSGR
jgi:aldose 1-epimerase